MLFVIGGLLGLLVLIIVLLQIPAVQTRVTQKVADRFAKQWGTEVRIGRVNINFFETATLEDVYIEDQAGDTLIWAGSLKADIGVFALFDQVLVLDEIALERAYVNLYRHQDSTKFNYAFIADSFAADTTVADTTTGGFSFDLHQLRLEQVRLRFADDSSSMNLHVRAPYLLAELETLGLEEQFVKISKIDIRDLQGSFRQLAPSLADDTLATAPEAAQALDSAFLNPSGFHVTVDDFTVKNTQFHFQTSQLAEQGTLNFENLDLRSINIGIQDFYLAGDTLKLKVDQLAAVDRNSGFVLENIAMDIALEMPMFSGTLREVITPRTRLTDEIRIDQISLKPGADMLATMQLSANIKDAAISMEDAAYFTPSLDTLPKLKDLTLLLDLDASAADNKASFSPLHLRTSDGGLNLHASANASGLNNLNTMRFDIKVQQLSTTVNYLEQFSFVPPLPPGARQAGRLHLIAQAKGTPSNIDATARLRSGAGLLESNMLYRAPTASRFLLTGNIDVTNFDLAPFVGDSLGLGSITLSSKMRIDGKGEQIDVEKFSLLIDSVEYSGYTYKGLAAEGFFVDSVLEAVAAYEDPYLSFDLLARSDLKDSLPLMHAELNLDRINMYRLNLSPDSIIFSTTLLADVRGQDPDQIEGEVVLRDTEAIRGAESWTMDSLIMVSTKEPSGEREIRLTSDFATASLSGTYLFKNLQNAIDQFASHYYTAYMPNEDMVAYNQNIKLEINMWDEPAIAKAFLPQLELTHPMTLTAELRDADKSFDLDMDAPGISWADSIVIRKLVVDAKTENRVMSFDVNTDKIRIGEMMDIPAFRLDGQWRQDSIHFLLGIAPSSDSSRLVLGGALHFHSDTTILALNRTELALKGKEYEMANDASIKLATDYLYINNLSLGRENQLLSINTAQEDSPNPLLIAEIADFQIADFMEILGLTELGLAASLDGRLQLTQPLNISAIEADLMVNNLMVDSLPVGNIKAEMNKVSAEGRIKANLALKGPSNDLSLDGFFNIEDSTNAMGLDINIRSFNLEPWEPFVKEFITEISGNLQGNIDVGGSVQQPQVNGNIGFSDNTAFRLAMTGSRYTMPGNKISIDNEAIRLNSFTLRDSLQQELVVDGQVFHDAFLDYRLDLDIDTDNFQVVNKIRDLDALFYGELYISTDANIRGPLNNLFVSGEARINEQTDFALVIHTEEAKAGTASYINFVNRHAFLENDTTYATLPVDTLTQQANTSYFTMNAALSVPAGASFTIVVDPNTGDFLEVQGTADMQVRMEPSGDLNLQGTYEVSSGRYRLSFMELIQKSFQIEEGSTIEFNGDPLAAEIDLTAIYTTEASRLPLVNSYVEEGSAEYAAAREKAPVSVLLSMSGTLESPSFSFDIIAPESQQGAMSSSAVATRLDEIKNNESELFRQVFGLIVLNRFIAENPLEAGPGGGGAAGAVAARIDESLGQFLTDQLNALTQDYLGVEIEIDIDSQQGGSGNIDGGRDVGFSLSRSLFNDRIEVEVGGTSAVGGGAGGAGSTGSTQFAGNFAILYHINERGNLNLKIFQRSERDYVLNEFIPKTGIALSYSRRFNTLNGLFGRDPNQSEMLKSDGAVKSDL